MNDWDFPGSDNEAQQNEPWVPLHIEKSVPMPVPHNSVSPNVEDNTSVHH